MPIDDDLLARLADVLVRLWPPERVLIGVVRFDVPYNHLVVSKEVTHCQVYLHVHSNVPSLGSRIFLFALLVSCDVLEKVKVDLQLGEQETSSVCPIKEMRSS